MHYDAHGPVNLCCVQTPTNAEFTKTLAGALHRPAFATVPAKVLQVAAGPMAPELLGSVNARPEALLEGIVLHAFEGKAPFSARTLANVRALREVYGLDLTAADSHRLAERGEEA